MTLQEMQLLVEAEYTIERTREDLTQAVEFFKSLDYWEHAIDVAMVNERKLPKDTALEHDVFFIDEEMVVDEIPEEYRVEALGLVRKNYVVYAGRLVYPVKDVRGKVMGFCGWDNMESPKYLDSKNHGYKAKQNTLYGMEKLTEYYTSGNPVYFTEGIVCCLYLRSIGLQALAFLGSSITPYVLEIMRRFAVVVVISDNDVLGHPLGELHEFKPAGEHLVQIVKHKVSKAIVVQSLIAKDVDDTRLVEECKFEKKFIEELRTVAKCPYLPFMTIRVR